MSKYKVTVGGFVSTFRQRTLIIYAENEEEAAEKAEARFIELSQQRPGNMCDEGSIDHIEKLQ